MKETEKMGGRQTERGTDRLKERQRQTDGERDTERGHTLSEPVSFSLIDTFVFLL